MPACEMCGKEAKLIAAEIENVEMKVCSGCVKFGRVKRSSSPSRFQNFKAKAQLPELPQVKIVSNYAALLRSARERKGMTQEDFAKYINEKESLVQKWESGHLKPNVNTAKKLESFLGITLVTKDEEISSPAETHRKAEGFTIGDFIKVKKK
ncbi:MAG: multiprotein bridging factor aMBF1 [Nanoarchaeota archaeon]